MSTYVSTKAAIHTLLLFHSWHHRLTSIPWAVRLSWLEDSYSRPLWIFRRTILTSREGQTKLVFGVRSGFISRSVHARLQFYV